MFISLFVCEDNLRHVRVDACMQDMYACATVWRAGCMYCTVDVV